MNEPKLINKIEGLYYQGGRYWFESEPDKLYTAEELENREQIQGRFKMNKNLIESVEEVSINMELISFGVALAAGFIEIWNIIQEQECINEQLEAERIVYGRLVQRNKMNNQ